MKLNSAAAFASIVSGIIAVLVYFQITPSNDTKAKNNLESLADAVTITADKPEYRSEKAWLKTMFDAATEMPTYDAQCVALDKVVDAALDASDFNIAILAAKKSPTYNARDRSLTKIIEFAIRSKETIQFGLVAARSCSSYENKQLGLQKVVNAYQYLFAQKGNPHETEVRPNQALLPTPMSVTPPAGQEARQP